MKRFFFLLCCIFLITATALISAQDSYKKIESYNPETDPQVNFPQKSIDDATGATSEETATAGPSKEGEPTVTPAAEGTMQAKLIKSASELYKKYAKPGSFPYHSATNNGSKGCAQVANPMKGKQSSEVFKLIRLITCKNITR